MEVLSRQFSKREKFLIGFLAFIILCSAYYFFVHQPVTDRINRANSMIDMLNIENEQLGLREIQKKQMLEEVNAVLQNPDVQEIPEYDNLSALTAFLNLSMKRSKSYEITCGDVKLDENTGIYRRPVNIQCNVADYETGKAIMEDIKTCPYCSQIISVEFKPFIDKTKLDENGMVIQIDNIEDAGVTLNLSMVFYETR